MSEMLDDSNVMKEKRGQTILVLAILSWIWIGFSIIVSIYGATDGKKTAEEMENEKFKLYDTATPEVMEIMGENYVTDTVKVMEVANDNFYFIQVSTFFSLLIGFYGVLLMYQLKKKGYYFYLVYNLVPIIVALILYDMGFIMLFGIIFNLVFSALFCLLYGLQLKRMS